jgi:hypothetical protein
LPTQLAFKVKNMKKVFLIEKVEAGKTKYLFKVYQAAHWTEDIRLASSFDSEKKAEDYLNEEVREQKKLLFRIITFYTNR